MTSCDISSDPSPGICLLIHPVASPRLTGHPLPVLRWTRPSRRSRRQAEPPPSRKLVSPARRQSTSQQSCSTRWTGRQRTAGTRRTGASRGYVSPARAAGKAASKSRSWRLRGWQLRPVIVAEQPVETWDGYQILWVLAEGPGVSVHARAGEEREVESAAEAKAGSFRPCRIQEEIILGAAGSPLNLGSDAVRLVF